MVEDEEKLVYLLRKALLRNQYNVLVAPTGHKPIDLYRRRKQDIGVVLLDIGLPKIAGLDVILRMKRRKSKRKSHRLQWIHRPWFQIQDATCRCAGLHRENPTIPTTWFECCALRSKVRRDNWMPLHLMKHCGCD